MLYICQLGGTATCVRQWFSEFSGLRERLRRPPSRTNSPASASAGDHRPGTSSKASSTFDSVRRHGRQRIPTASAMAVRRRLGAQQATSRSKAVCAVAPISIRSHFESRSRRQSGQTYISVDARERLRCRRFGRRIAVDRPAHFVLRPRSACSAGRRRESCRSATSPRTARPASKIVDLGDDTGFDPLFGVGIQTELDRCADPFRIPHDRDR